MPLPYATPRLAAALVLLAAGCAASPDSNPPQETAAPAAMEPAVPASVVQALDKGQPQRLIVLLDEAPAAEARRALAGRTAAEVTASATAALERAKDDLLAGAGGADVGVLHRYPSLPALHLEVRSSAALARLLIQSAVLRVVEDAPQEAFLAQSLPLIHQPPAAAAGALGQGTAVAVLDTGVDYTRPEFGSCIAPSVPASCRVAFAEDFAPSDGKLDDNGHGTNVAAIVAGVAPKATILALDVFKGAYAYSSDILSAIDWCVRNQAIYNIVALNMSLGSGGSTTACGSDVFAGAIHTARAAGILTAAASGNNGYTNRISSPACAPDAVSVGAVYDSTMGGIGYSICSDATTAADQVACFSNSASFLTLLAPGALITAGGSTMAGTSQAAPHVAGAVAVYKSAAPSATPDQVVAFLKTSGVPVTDWRNGLVTPRVDLAKVPAPGCAMNLSPAGLTIDPVGGHAILTVSAGTGCTWNASTVATWLSVSPSSGTGPGAITVTAPLNASVSRSATVAVSGYTVTVSQAKDAVAPTGTVTIGEPRYTRTLAVPLHITGSDAAGITAMCLSNTTHCTAWQAFLPNPTWTLTAGAAGLRTVYVWLRDAALNVSGALTATVTYDVTAPVEGVLTAVAGKGGATVSWSGFSDLASGIAGYQLVYAAKVAPVSCTAGTTLYSGTGTSYQAIGLVKAVPYFFRLCATDGAGNTSAGKVASAVPR